MAKLISRRDLLTAAGTSGAAMLYVYAALPAAAKAFIVRELPVGPGCTSLTEGQRHTLRGLCDAVVPGLFEGVVEDRLENGSPGAGADAARVVDWIESTSASFPWPLDWLTCDFLGDWANDLDLWSDVFHGWPLDGRPKFWELPLDPSILGRGRQHKIILMQALFHTAIDVKYQAGIMISKVAFYCDLWHEANEPGTRVGRAYIGFPLPPGYTPYRDFGYNRVLASGDRRLGVVNRNRCLIGAP